MMTVQTREGIQRAVDHADRVNEGWSEDAFKFLKTFMLHRSEFLTEDVREAAHGIVADPPNLKAWGGVITRAAKAGLIVSIGYKNAKNVQSHQRPSTLWKRVKA